MTPERIAELRELNQVYGETWFFHPTLGELLDALESAQQEIAARDAEIAKMQEQFRDYVERSESDAMELRKEIAHVRGIMEAGEKECRHREEQDRVYRTKITILENQIADLKRGWVVVPEIPTWEDGENKLRRGETLTALEKFVMDHDWNKMDASFRDGLEAVFAELRANHRTITADRELMRLVDELIRWHGLRPLDKRPDHAAALVGAIKALRAQPTQEPKESMAPNQSKEGP